MIVAACFRAIFLWLCSKDLSKLKFPNPEKGSPEEILMNLQQGYTTYARVYEMLCRLYQLTFIHCSLKENNFTSVVQIKFREKK